MVLKKKKKMPHQTTSSNDNTNTNGVQVFQESADHWAFLDEIEAPMWVDLTLECTSAYEDKDCEWFKISHPFHEFSSRQLISLFSGLGEGCLKLDFGIAGPSSPKIPSSVSKSRGKHDKRMEWGKGKYKPTLSKRHPVKNLRSKGCWVNLGSDKAVKEKTSIGKVKDQTGLKSGTDGESSLSNTAVASCSTSASSFGNSENHTNFAASSVVDSYPTSTITSEGTGPEQQKSLEVSSQVLGHTSRLLSALRVTLRKSCVTRQASRMEVNRARQSEGRKSSSSSKSSIGSSSNPGSDGKNLTARLSKDKTPESRNITRMSHASNEKVKIANVSEKPNSDSNCDSERFASLHINQGTKEAEARHQNIRPKVLVPCIVNEHIRTTVAKAKEMKGSVCHNRSAQVGKENEGGRITVVQQSSSSHSYPTAATKAKERIRALSCTGTVGGSKVNADRTTALSQKFSTLEKRYHFRPKIQKGDGSKRAGMRNWLLRRTEELVAKLERRTMQKQLGRFISDRKAARRSMYITSTLTFPFLLA